MNKVFIASDHGGYNLKQLIISKMSSNQDFELIDLGPYVFDPTDDYPDYAFMLARKVACTNGSLGILVCRSGNGMSIAANKVKGVYASLCCYKDQAVKARQHNNSNVLCLDADYGGDDPLEIVKLFIESKFEENEVRHVRRFRKIQNFESQAGNND